MLIKLSEPFPDQKNKFNNILNIAYDDTKRVACSLSKQAYK